MTVMPPTQFEADFTCRAAGDYCYVMIADSVWNAGLVDSADCERIVERFERTSPRDSLRGVWQHNTQVLGLPPDELDQDSAIYLIYYNVGTFMGSSFDGFWMEFDEYYDTTAQRVFGYRSNEIECVYLDCWPNNPSSDYRVAIAAHEMGHMISWNYDPPESLWVQEGGCELAMWLFGAPDPVTAFFSNPDVDLTAWTGSWADYIKVYLWFLYQYEQHGPELITRIVQSPYQNIAGIEAALDSAGIGASFADIFDDWVLANRINDTAVLGGRYGYRGETVPAFGNAAVHASYPVNASGSLARWAGEYYRFTGGDGLDLGFDGANAASFTVHLVATNAAGDSVIVIPMALDSLNAGQLAFPGFGPDWPTAWLVPANHTPAGRMTFNYTAASVGIAEERAAARPAPRPATVVRGSLRLPSSLNPSLPTSLLDPTGRKVLDLCPGDNDLSRVAPGLYFIRDPQGTTARLVLLR
jgi:hypothetical protein